MTGKRLPKERWWDCHVHWLSAAGLPIDLLFFLKNRTRAGALKGAEKRFKDLKNCGLVLRKTKAKITARLARDYQPGSKSYTWHVQRGPWVPSPGER